MTQTKPTSDAHTSNIACVLRSTLTLSRINDATTAKASDSDPSKSDAPVLADNPSKSDLLDDSFTRI